MTRAREGEEQPLLHQRLVRIPQSSGFEVGQRMIGRRRDARPLKELTPRERELLTASIVGKLGLQQAPEDHRCVLALLQPSSGARKP